VIVNGLDLRGIRGRDEREVVAIDCRCLQRVASSVATDGNALHLQRAPTVTRPLRLQVLATLMRSGAERQKAGEVAEAAGVAYWHRP
jgi:hypothetical protein